MTVGASTFPVKMVEDLKARIKELEEENRKLSIRLENCGYADLRPKFDSYGQFDGYYP